MIILDLWLWPLTLPTDRFVGLLSPDEAARAARFVAPAHGDAYRTGRGRLREILGGYCAVAPQMLRFDYNAHGKPALAGGPAFNLSHAAGWAALVVAPAAPAMALGIDIEAHRTVEHGLADRFFSAAERADLAMFPPDQWQDGFFRCWTRKEAMVKACGPGLSMPLDSFDVTLTPTARLTRLEGACVADWTLLHLDLAPGFVGAVAAESRGAPCTLRLCEGHLPLP